MEIISNQCYELNNLVSISGKYKAAEVQNLLIDLVKTYKDYSVANGDYVITTTKSIEIVNGEQILDVEVLIPVLYRIPVEEPYVFKNTLKLSNALYTKTTEITRIQEAIDTVNQYILDQRLQPITTAYLVQTKKEGKPFVEIYIGINPNIL
ncbi:hypothetical protein H0486_17375 [Lachnospiraceae bacterium MD1]|jgi:hypothetical protein|uniref:DUF5085 family protein n=1 Tax=Variimorphobacter saccharofermentans TaxID=2755051 RepID=A0A839K417_9FIRM|nr:hypothetical protein [Variimorphobacter saccharofermentans]MBB2184643.1 hypothetical protein [Variimorphobacter saccharofermentans]